MTLFYRITILSLALFFRLFYRHRTIFLDKKPYPKGSIIAANHTSYFDPPIIGASWRTSTHYLANEKLFSIPFLGFLIRQLHTHPVGKKKEIASLKLSCKLLGEKKNVLIFPEGTRSEDGSLQPFRRGVGLLARKTQSPIIPTYIHGAREAWPKDEKFPRLFKGKTACIFGKPIHYEEIATIDDQEIADRIHKEVTLLKEHYLNTYK